MIKILPFLNDIKEGKRSLFELESLISEIGTLKTIEVLKEFITQQKKVLFVCYEQGLFDEGYIQYACDFITTFTNYSIPYLKENDKIDNFKVVCIYELYRCEDALRYLKTHPDYCPYIEDAKAEQKPDLKNKQVIQKKTKKNEIINRLRAA